MAKTIRILIAEDVPTDAELIERELRKTGIDFETKRVDTQEGYIEALSAFRPELIISDYSMPSFDGLRAIELAKEAAGNIPVIIATSPRNEETAVECMKAGAVDYVIKDRLLRMGPAVLAALEAKGAREEKEQARQSLARMHSEVRVARQVQRKLYPASAPSVRGYDIAGASYPALTAGGDYLDFIPLQGGTIGIAVGDVSGHGIDAALVMALTHGYVRALALDMTDVKEMLTRLNRLMVAETPPGCFCTMILGQLDPRGRSLVYTSAGHETGYVLDSSGGVKHLLESTALPLGEFLDADFPAAPALSLEPGDLVAFFTDGIVEAASSAGTMFGSKRALEVIAAHRERPAREIIDALYRAACDFSSERTTEDDVTVAIIKVNGLHETGGGDEAQMTKGRGGSLKQREDHGILGGGGGV